MTFLCSKLFFFLSSSFPFLPSFFPFPFSVSFLHLSNYTSFNGSVLRSSFSARTRSTAAGERTPAAPATRPSRRTPATPAARSRPRPRSPRARHAEEAAAASPNQDYAAVISKMTSPGIFGERSRIGWPCTKARHHSGLQKDTGVPEKYPPKCPFYFNERSK